MCKFGANVIFTDFYSVFIPDLTAYFASLKPAQYGGGELILGINFSYPTQCHLAAINSKD